MTDQPAPAEQRPDLTVDTDAVEPEPSGEEHTHPPFETCDDCQRRAFPDSTGLDKPARTADLRQQYADALHAAGGPFANASPEVLADAVLAVQGAERDELRQRAEAAEALLRDLLHPDTCDTDSGGYCQAHGWRDPDGCPHARAREHLAALDGTQQPDDPAARLRAHALTPDGTHQYLSTGCLHDDHTYCQNNTGLSGAKTPARCKGCKAPCLCPCHAPERSDDCPTAESHNWGCGCPTDQPAEDVGTSAGGCQEGSR